MKFYTPKEKTPEVNDAIIAIWNHGETCFHNRCPQIDWDKILYWCYLPTKEDVEQYLQTKWEYKFYQPFQNAEYHPDHLESYFNRLGNEGWEMINTTDKPPFMFKRKKEIDSCMKDN